MSFLKDAYDYITDLFTSPFSTSFFTKEYEEYDEEGEEITKLQKVPKLYYEKFTVKNFKGIKKVDVNFAKDDLVLLLGLNESGKTTILKGIEAFDFRNDPDKDTNPQYFTSIRRKSEVDFDGEAIITADIILESKLPTTYIKNYDELVGDVNTSDLENLKDFINQINTSKRLTISRVFIFSNGQPTYYYYKFESTHSFASTKLSNFVASEIIKICPPVIYFEDFKDRIPERIFVNKKSDSFDAVWYDIIDGLFYNAKPTYTIEKFKQYYQEGEVRSDDAKTVLRKANIELNKIFTNRWKKLSGVRQIADTVLEYNPEKQYFQLKIYDADGTNFSVDERSKGALWYLSFLMKTEFRSKKMRKNSGKPVYLIDEPASNLHSTAQIHMIGNFIRLVKDTSIVYTTHSQYLISLKSVKNTYIIKRSKNGLVSATKWADYIKDNAPDEKYYQPLANLLNIIPTNFDIPWDKAVITEGPSDMHVLKLMHNIIYNEPPKFAIYPGTSATKLDTLISLNLGWNSKFKVLLDSDEAGKNAAKKYREDFKIDKQVLTLLKDNSKIEDYFSNKDKIELYKIAFDEKDKAGVKKKELASAISLLNEKEGVYRRVKKALSDDTKKAFKELFEALDMK